jgi:outer membrane receptor protein involved in Fe transport
MTPTARLLLGCTLFALAAPAAAQSTDAPAASADAEAAAEEIVVTAVARGENPLDASVSISTLSPDDIAAASPRSVAELFRSIPGIRSESSGGEGNANIAVRGLPVASGGAKFLQLQEDGLPVLEFGDITFGNADIFLRADFNVARIEAVRGGSASTFASNAPGGVINLISKTGATEGGALQGSVGLDYGEYRLDFDYGAPLGDDLTFHVGGFYRQGEGPRDIGYDGLKGGQIKANVTKSFDGGYVRFFGKYLDDRAVAYLPNPIQVTGSNSDPTYRNLPGFSITGDSLHSRHFRSALTLDGANNPARFDLDEGMRPLVKSLGFEASLDVAEGWTVLNRFRFSDISGGFISPFPASVDTAAATAAALGGAGATAVFANGPNAGQAVPVGTNVASIVLFNTRLNSLDNVTNDLRLTRDLSLGAAEGSVTLGFYKSRQDIDTEWLWTSHLLEVRGGGNAALVDVRSAGGALLTSGGTVGYGATFFGNCCRRVYDVSYDTNAPFASLNLGFGALSVDASVRWDFGQAEGATLGADLGGGRVGVVPTDVDGNGVISGPEQLTSVVPLSSPSPVDYDYDYLSYSLGANYRLTDDLALFANYARGGRANADRLLFDPNNIDFLDGAVRRQSLAVDFVRQIEGGAKYRAGPASLYATLFHAKTQEQNFEATTQRSFDRSYEAWGVELEGGYRWGGFSLTAGATYTDAEITRDSRTPALEGNRPRRQAELVYQLTPRYEAERFALGAAIVGTTDSFAGDTNELKLPGFTQVNAFAEVRPIERVTLAISANNLFDVKGFTEAEEGTIPPSGIVRARSINGRTVSASLRFDF